MSTFRKNRIEVKVEEAESQCSEFLSATDRTLQFHDTECRNVKVSYF
jgi:hypothetical protein